MRQKIVAANWKMNKTLKDGVALAKELQQIMLKHRPSCRVILAPPFIHLAPLADFLQRDLIGLSAQNIANHKKGAYTGEVSAAMVASAGCQYTLIGHSERRSYYHETSEILQEKLLLALEGGLIPIFCIGEQLEDREAGRQNEVISNQLHEALFNLSSELFKGIILAYEPVWAIGTGKTATPQEANTMHQHIRSDVARQYGKDVALNTSILYGGSCNANNAKELFAMSDIDGGLIGGASLSVEKFLPIIEALQ